MTIRNFLQHVGRRAGTPQNEPIPGTVPNSAGGYSFPLDRWQQLERFLVLGTEGGSYYATERALTRENARVVEQCLAEDGVRCVRTIAQVSQAGRAPRQDPAILALALAVKTGDAATKAEAQRVLRDVVRTGTHLYQLAEAVQAFGGWGRGTRRTFGNWFLAQEPQKLAYQLVKYQGRGGWTSRDVLRKAHPKAEGSTQQLLAWATKGWPEVGELPPEDAALELVWAFEQAKRAQSAGEVVRLVERHGLPRECVPTHFLNDAAVWAALLDNQGRGMPLTALVRNLGKMTEVGLLQPLSDATAKVAATLRDGRALQKARVHPLALLVAQRTYAQGHGDKGKLRWTPVPEIVAALEDAFYLAFGNVPATGKRLLLALDVSGSMTMGRVANSPLTPREASAAMALVTLHADQRCHVVGFTGGQQGLTPLRIQRGQRLNDAVRYTEGLPFGTTDCALPMVWAQKQRLQVDAFVVYTDSETWAGQPHPCEALRTYREQTGIAAKLVVVGMVSNGFTIADPADAGMLDVVGFDTAAPALVADFLAK